VLFQGEYEFGPFSASPNYDVHLDGQRFVMIKGDENQEASNQFNIILNWFEELKRLVPTGNN
jgi:hypothetical protein